MAITIPAGLYAELVLKQSLANVDWLHGGAESFLTIANILVVLGFSMTHPVASSNEVMSAPSVKSSDSKEV